MCFLLKIRGFGQASDQRNKVRNKVNLIKLKQTKTTRIGGQIQNINYNLFDHRTTAQNPKTPEFRQNYVHFGSTQKHSKTGPQKPPKFVYFSLKTRIA